MTELTLPTANAAWTTWCPSDSVWAPWAKPLLFAVGDPPVQSDPAAVPEIPGPLRNYDAGRPDTFVIADVPGPRGVAVGLGLAQVGFRPVPLYNGVPGVGALVEVSSIQRALTQGTTALAACRLRENAPPAFLLDANRMMGRPVPRDFDNRWVVIPEDFPSATRLLAHGLRRCVLVAAPAHDDLGHVLARWADAGITFELVANDTLVPYTPARPSNLVSVFRRLAVSVGLRRSSAGGFGGHVPEPSSAGGG